MNATDHAQRLAQPLFRCMSDTFITLPQESTLRHAAKALRDRDVGMLLVTSGDELVGVFAEQDVVTAIADGDHPDDVRLADRARGNIITIAGKEPLQAGITEMARAGIRHLIVVGDEDEQPVGVLSARDVLAELARV